MMRKKKENKKTAQEKGTIKFKRQTFARLPEDITIPLSGGEKGY